MCLLPFWYIVVRAVLAVHDTFAHDHRKVTTDRVGGHPGERRRLPSPRRARAKVKRWSEKPMTWSGSWESQTPS